MLEKLLELPAVDLPTAMERAAQFLQEILNADKVDAFLYLPAKNLLQAVGTSDTPLGRLQVSQGLDLYPIANGGSVVDVYLSGQPHITGHTEQDPREPQGLVRVLGVRSHIAVPLEVAGERRGVLSAQSQAADFFTEDDLRFLQAVSHWVGVVAHRAELVEATAAAALETGRRIAAEDLLLVLAHDLRNHLSPLRSRIEVLRLRAMRDGRQGDVQDAELLSKGIDRLGHLVSDLLDVGRLERGIFSVQLVLVDLAALVRETAQALATSDIPVHVDGPEKLLLNGDPDRIRQAVENLLGNAIKHSPSGKPVHVQLRADLHADPLRRLVSLEVTDQGAGISPDVLPHVFERFVKSTSSSGLGLGLYLASRIASAHGGTLTVRSAPGEGASFRLALPADMPPEEP